MCGKKILIEGGLHPRSHNIPLKSLIFEINCFVIFTLNAGQSTSTNMHAWNRLRNGGAISLLRQ